MSEIRGIDRDGVQEFRGIRYAVCERLETPVDVESWERGFSATAFGSQAPQIAGPLENLLAGDEVTSSEDCLFLNVVTPARDSGRRPVLVFVHGGAFVTGSGSMPWYDGAPLATRGDVVVVTINYRLGALGFLGDRNLGSLDQISALRWIGRNIESFGGASDQVTVFGESAGGASVVSLLAAPAADQLFHRAWAMSPSIPQLRDPAAAARTERLFLEQIGGAGIDHLLGLGTDEVLAAQTGDPALANDLQSFAPTEQTRVFPDPFADRTARDSRPLVVGTTRDEMALFTVFDRRRSSWNDDDLVREFQRRFPNDPSEAIDCYRRARPTDTTNQLVSALQTDELFRQPAQRLAEARARQGRGAWMYLFDQTSSAFGGELGSCHGLDLPFVFDTLNAPGAEMFTGSDAGLAAVAQHYSGALIEFARTGDPGWPAYETTRRATQRIGPSPTVVDDPDTEIRELWSR